MVAHFYNAQRSNDPSSSTGANRQQVADVVTSELSIFKKNAYARLYVEWRTSQGLRFRQSAHVGMNGRKQNILCPVRQASTYMIGRAGMFPHVQSQRNTPTITGAM